MIRDLKAVWDKAGEPDSAFGDRMHELKGNRSQGDLEQLLLDLIKEMVDYARQRGRVVGN